MLPQFQYRTGRVRRAGKCIQPEQHCTRLTLVLEWSRKGSHPTLPITDSRTRPSNLRRLGLFFGSRIISPNTMLYRNEAKYRKLKTMGPVLKVYFNFYSSIKLEKVFLLFLLFNCNDVALGDHKGRRKSLRVTAVFKEDLVFILGRLGQLIDDRLVEASSLWVQRHHCREIQQQSPFYSVWMNILLGRRYHLSLPSSENEFRDCCVREYVN